jgi:hypothetical protein
MIVCTKCGHENQMGRIFCFQCGERLDLEAVKPPKEAKEFWGKVRRKERIRQGRGMGLAVWRWSRLLIFLGLVVCLTLIFVPPELKLIAPGSAEQRSAQQKLAQLNEALDKGQAVTVTFTEGEVVTLIPELKAEAGTVSVVSYQAESRHLELSDDAMIAAVSGHLRFGTALSLPVVVRLAGNLKAKNGATSFAETGLHIGRLPIPKLLMPLFQTLMNRMENFWSDEDLKVERARLNRAREISVRGETLVIEAGEPSTTTPLPETPPRPSAAPR